MLTMLIFWWFWVVVWYFLAVFAVGGWNNAL